MMVNKSLVFVTRRSRLLLLLLVLTSSTFGNPLSRRDESVTKKIVDFNVHVTESGEEYNETIEVDTQNQTEVFKVPAHPGVERSDVMHDFKQKLTMIRIPDRGICYLMPLPKELSTPEKLIDDLEKTRQVVINKVIRIDTSWMTNGELTERSFLSDDLQQFCTDFPIYLLKKSQDSLDVTGIQKTEIKTRLRRQTLQGRPLCAGGMTYNETLARCSKPELRCKIPIRTCSKSVTCPVDHRSRRQLMWFPGMGTFGGWRAHHRSFFRRQWSPRRTHRGRNNNGCRVSHQLVSVVDDCCQYICQ